MAVTGVKVFGVALLQGGRTAPLAPEVLPITYRELGVVARRAPYAHLDATDEELAEYDQVIRTVFQHHTILPAPFGLVFRSTDQVSRWLQMNYIALAEGLHFVEGRWEARVHVTDTLERGHDADGAEAGVLAAECFRALRRSAAAAVPLRPRRDPGRVLSSAFLVEQTRWDEFLEQVAEQARRHGGLQIEHSGPWPPYDFVRLDVGA